MTFNHIFNRVEFKFLDLLLFLDNVAHNEIGDHDVGLKTSVLKIASSDVNELVHIDQPSTSQTQSAACQGTCGAHIVHSITLNIIEPSILMLFYVYSSIFVYTEID